MNNPLVSVIVPNYNHEKFLEQRINSILNQTFQDFELILIDDKSTDNSLTILNKFKNHPKVSHLIINEINSGSPFKQWFKGINVAEGKYIWIAETDDFADTSFLNDILNVFFKNKKLNLVYTDSKYIDENNNVLYLSKNRKNNHYKNNRWSSSYINDGFDEIIEFLFNKTTINNMSASVFKREVLASLKWEEIFNFKNIGDRYVYTYSIINGNVGYISSSLNYLRIHENNLTAKNVTNGSIFLDRIIYSISVLDSLMQKEMTIKQKLNLRKSIKWIISKNMFLSIEFGFLINLTTFLKKVNQHNLISFKEYFTLRILFILYSIKFKKGNTFIKKSINTYISQLK